MQATGSNNSHTRAHAARTGNLHTQCLAPSACLVSFGLASLLSVPFEPKWIRKEEEVERAVGACKSLDIACPTAPYYGAKPVRSEANTGSGSNSSATRWSQGNESQKKCPQERGPRGVPGRRWGAPRLSEASQEAPHTSACVIRGATHRDALRPIKNKVWGTWGGSNRGLDASRRPHPPPSVTTSVPPWWRICPLRCQGRTRPPATCATRFFSP